MSEPVFKMQNMVSLHCVVSGIVQGVGYRWFVETTAKACGLTGWVKNLSNGKVEIEIEGAKDVLESFLSAIKSGHSGAMVTRVEAVWRPQVENVYKSFEIIY